MAREGREGLMDLVCGYDIMGGCIGPNSSRHICVCLFLV